MRSVPRGLPNPAVRKLPERNIDTLLSTMEDSVVLKTISVGDDVMAHNAAADKLVQKVH